MKTPQYALVWCASIATLALSSIQAVAAESFRNIAGLQLWSLREQFKTGVPAALDSVKSFGFTQVETAGTNSLPADEFRKLLDERQLKAVGGHFQYAALQKDLPQVINNAKALGLTYVVCPWIPHTPGSFGLEDAKKAAADFNQWGEQLKNAGLHFAYHPHGYEFRPLDEGGTIFDTLAKETKPECVAFEMDVFWVVQPGADPVELLHRYSGRWQLMHLKDIRKGSPTRIYTGSAPKTDDVPLGTGQVNWTAVLEAAQKNGVRYYFIEDESPTVSEQIPQSLKFLESIPQK